ncbi:MAG TPA: hypothetical protein VHB97_24945 [Polyangia bacterium]|jgi:hypothetical protein|nr:hypothetical protein [Polyangia bacterium]
MRARSTWRFVLLCASAAAAACGPGHEPHPSGTLTIVFAPMPANVASLTLSSAMLVVDRIEPIGNVPPPPGPPPILHVPIDATSTAEATVDFPHLPQGIYSRLEFSVDNVAVAGSWRGTPFTVSIDMFGGAEIDLRSNVGVPIGPDEGATMTVGVDVSGWFAGDVLDNAMVSGGQITCDAQNNPAVTAQLSSQVAASFSLR